MATGNLPTGVNERVAWSINFEEEFPAIAPGLGISAEEIKDAMDNVKNLRFGILRAQKAQAFSKACTEYKNAMLSGVGETQDLPELPVFTDIAAPPELSEAGIVPFINNLLQRIKLNKNYSEAIGQTLMIASSEEESLNLTDAKPAGQATAMTGSIVRIDWVKGKYDGVIIESQRGSETSWIKLDRDFRSPYEDERAPLAPGQPEERRYRLRYFLDDQAVGDWSDVIVVITKP